jgi:hypothetical protein
MEQIDLYRDTRDSIIGVLGVAAFRGMSPAARERALIAEMRAERNLHPAFMTPDGHYKVRFTFGVLLRRSDVSCRAVCALSVWLDPIHPFRPRIYFPV